MDKSVFHSSMSNRLLDRYPGRGVLHTPHIDSTSTLSPFAGRLVGRMQYAPTLPAEKSDLKGWRGVMFWEKVRNPYFFSPCLIGYQIGTHVGRKSIRPLRVYRIPPRPLQGVW